jgi:hypothetical protein
MPEDFNKKLKEWQQIQVLNNIFFCYIYNNKLFKKVAVLSKYPQGSIASIKDT